MTLAGERRPCTAYLMGSQALAERVCPRGGILAATSDNDTDGTYVTCVWDMTGKLLATFQDPGSLGVTRIAFSPDGSILAVGDENANTWIRTMNWQNS